MEEAIRSRVDEGRRAFASAVTRPLEFREAQLHALLTMYEDNTAAILAALAQDLRKSKQEAMVSEVEYLKNDVRTMLDNVRAWARPRCVEKGIVNALDRVVVLSEPYGLVLIIGAWNYPFQLLLAPLAGAIAAGNCAILKPSEVAPASAALVERLLPRYLDRACFQVVVGGAAETTALLRHRFDYIFYTGGAAVGRIVYGAASAFLTPVTLELGGKSPVYLDGSVDLEVAAARIWWGKCLNAGQSCIAPDYLLCEAALVPRFVAASERLMQKWYGAGGGARRSPDYGRIINARHFARLVELLRDSDVLMGGDVDAEERFVHPTIVQVRAAGDPVMSEEIFGPILPIVSVDGVEEAVRVINAGEKPLAVYVFSSRKKDVDFVIENTSSGGVCVNDTLMHFSCEGLPFGGVGNSGIGAYHGKYSFETFSHRKGTLYKNVNRLGEALQSSRYPPYTDAKLKFITTMMKSRLKIDTKLLLLIFFYLAGVFSAFVAYYVYNYLQ